MKLTRTSDADSIDPEEIDWQDALDHGHRPDEVELPPPRLKQSRLGILGQFWSYRRHRKKQKKLAKKGYIRWHLVGGTFATPKYIKPDLKGGGIWEYEHDGTTYLFPEDALVPDARSWMWTCIHKEGQADPINIREPAKLSIDGDALKEYLSMRVTSSPPSLFDKLPSLGDNYVEIGLALLLGFIGLNILISGGGL